MRKGRTEESKKKEEKIIATNIIASWELYCANCNTVARANNFPSRRLGYIYLIHQPESYQAQFQ